ncbi:MAG: PAS domain S-box protein [Bacteroidetes bacterium]|nr:MAG: PAS domain S-box protein [Bacteroidota bacterium]
MAMEKSQKRTDEDELLRKMEARIQNGNREEEWNELKAFQEAISGSFLMAKVGLDGHILAVNKLFCEAIGFDEAELVGKAIHTLNSPLVPLEQALNLWEEISSGNVWRGEISKSKKDQSLLWVRATVVPLIRNGEIIQFVGIYLDITKSKRVESDLELFLSMLNQSNDAIQVADIDGRLQYVNQRSVDNLGYERDELIGKYVWEFEKIFDGLEDWVKHFNEVKANPNGMLQDGYNKRRDGSIFPVEVNVKYIVIQDKGYIIAILRDISERQQAQLQLMKNQQLLNEAQRVARISSFEYHSRTNKLEYSENTWRILGLQEDAPILLDKLKENIHPDDLVDLLSDWNNVLENGGLLDKEFRFYDAKDHLNYMRAILRSYVREESTGSRVIGTLQNITSDVITRNQLEKRTRELEQRNAELDQFAQIVSHDLKSPLRAIHNLSDWIEEGLPDLTDENQRNLGLLKKRVERMENLINGILHYSSAGKSKNPSVHFRAMPLLVDLAETIQTSYPAVEVHIGAVPELYCDQTAFEQVIGNLMSNAVKHNSNADPKVEVLYQEESNAHLFTVKDNGPGIDPEYHEKIFKMFQTLLPRDTMENTGVGLAIVKKICDELNWGLTLESEPGLGAEFRVSIPFEPVN